MCVQPKFAIGLACHAGFKRSPVRQAGEPVRGISTPKTILGIRGMKTTVLMLLLIPLSIRLSEGHPKSTLQTNPDLQALDDYKKNKPQTN